MPLCSVPGCNVSGVHLFPQEAKLKKQWETVIRRKNFVATEYSKLCRNHFKESDYVGESPYTGRLPKHRLLKKGTIPSIFPWMKSNSPSTSNRAQRYKTRTRRQPENAIYLNAPDIVDEEIVLSGTSPVRDPLEKRVVLCGTSPARDPLEKGVVLSGTSPARDPLEKGVVLSGTSSARDRLKKGVFLSGTSPASDPLEMRVALSGTSPVRDPLEKGVVLSGTSSARDRLKKGVVLSGTSLARDPLEMRVALSGTSPVRDRLEKRVVSRGTSPVRDPSEKRVKTTATQTNAKQFWFSIETIKNDPQVVHYYTGMETYAKFRLVLSTLSPMCNDLIYRSSKVINVSIDDQLLITLMKLRCNKPDIEISLMFQISQSTVSNIFVTWINFMSDVWSCVDLWPSKNLVQYYMPEQFKKDFLSTRIIIDTTEFPICKPSNPVAQQATFSTHKNRNTLKVMVGSTPGGLISYISEAYGGSISDRQVIERSDLLHKCEDGDSIMADRDFNVQDIFAPKNINIITPSVLKRKSQLLGPQLMKDYKLVSKQVHIEQIIGLTKTFKILKSELSPYYSPLGSKIMFVCAMLCNFREKMIS